MHTTQHTSAGPTRGGGITKTDSNWWGCGRKDKLSRDRPPLYVAAAAKKHALSQEGCLASKDRDQVGPALKRSRRGRNKPNLTNASARWRPGRTVVV